MGSRLPIDCVGVQPDSADLGFRQSLQVAGNRMYGSISSFFVLSESNNPAARNDFNSDSASAVTLAAATTDEDSSAMTNDGCPNDSAGSLADAPRML